MDKDKNIENYLEQVLALQTKKELYDGSFLEKKERENLLKKVITELGFDQTTYTRTKIEAQVAYLVAEQIFITTHHMLHVNFKKKYLTKALSLDPFNKLYLEKILNFENNLNLENLLDSEVKKQYQKRYLLLFKPSSLEYEDKALEFGLDSSQPLDYLDESITTPLIEEISAVDETQSFLSEVSENIDAQTLEQIAFSSGIDKEAIKDAKEESKEILDYLKDVAGDSREMDSYTGFLKFCRYLDRAYVYAPDNLFVLSLMVLALGEYYPRAIMSLSPFDREDTPYESKEEYLKAKKVFMTHMLKGANAEDVAIKAFQEAENLKSKLIQFLYQKIDVKPESILTSNIKKIEGSEMGLDRHFHPFKEKNKKLSLSFCVSYDISLQAFLEKSHINLAQHIPSFWKTYQSLFVILNNDEVQVNTQNRNSLAEEVRKEREEC